MDGKASGCDSLAQLVGGEVVVPGVPTGDGIEQVRGEERYLLRAPVCLVSTREEKDRDGVEDAGGVSGAQEVLEHVLPEGVAGPRCDECITDNLIHPARADARLVGVRLGFQAEHKLLPGQELVNGAQTLEVEVDVDATDVMEDEVAPGIGALDVLIVPVIDGEELGIVLVEESPNVLVRPEPILPHWVVAQPGFLQPAPFRRNGACFPGLVDNSGYHSVAFAGFS